MTNDNDLIRRGDALTILSNGSQTWGEAVAAISALRAIAASQPTDPVTNADSRQRVVVVEKPDRSTFDAMCAMRDAINEYIPMPSIESDLLQGPENSVFCATVTEAVVSEIRRLRAGLAAVKGGDA